MIRLIILIVIVALGAGFYFGVFTTDDSVDDIINKSKDIATQTASDLKDKALEKADDLKDQAAKKADELISKKGE